MKNNDSCIQTRRVTIIQLSVDNKERLMNILDFEKKHVKEALEIALANYNAERQYVKESTLFSVISPYQRCILSAGTQG